MAGQFEGGYTSAVDSASERTRQDWANQHLSQIIQERAIAMALQNALQQRQAAGRAGAAQQLFGPDAAAVGAPFAAPTSPPPAGAPPQAPMPGQASVPMAAPTGAPPMGEAGGMSTIPSMPPGASPEQGAAGPENSPSPGPSEPQAAPLGWQVGATASEELGGPPPGAEAPPLPQSVGAPPQSMIPPSMTVNGLIAGLQKAPMTPEAKYAAFEELYPKVLKQEVLNHQRFLDTLQVQKAGYMAERAEADKIRAETARDVGAARIGRMVASADQGQQKVDLSRQALDAKLTGKRPAPIVNLTADASPAERAAVDADIRKPKPDPNAVATAGAGEAGGLSQQGLDLAAAEFARTGKMPSFSRDPVERRRIINRAAEMEAEGGNTPGDTVTNRMDQKAVQGAYNAVTKDLAAIGPYNNMLETNGAVAKSLATKAIASSAQLANKPINWLRQNATDNPDVATYLAQMRIFTTEAARVLNNPRLVGQLTDSARHEMEGIVNGDMPLAATVGVIDRLTQDGKIRVGSMEDQAKFLRDRLAGKKDAALPAARGPQGQPPAAAGPKVGEVQKGYRFKGGDPSKPASWEKVQ